MEKEYINCKFALTPICPHQTHQFMIDLFAGTQKPTKIFTEKTINDANSLCSKCKDFSPRS